MDDNNTIIEINKDEDDTLYNDKIVKENIENNKPVIEIKPPKKKINCKKLAIIIGIIVLAVAIIGIIVWLVFFYDKKQKEVLKPEESIQLVKDNYKYVDGMLTILDENSKEIGTYDCTSKDPEKCYVAFYNNDTSYDMPKYVDENDNLINKRSKVYYDTFVFIKDDNEINLYNMKTNKIETKYKAIYTLDEQPDYIITVDEDNHYGYILIEESINVLLANKYSYLGTINSINTLVYNDGNCNYLIDESGNTLTNKIKDDIKNFNELYIATYDGNYNLIDYRGTKLLSNYDYINFYEGIIIAIKDSQMYLYNQDLLKLNEKGINIKTDTYNTKYVFDSNNNLKNIIKPYTLSISENAINIETSKGLVSKTININEALISQNYDYVSYLDGVLYFYKNKDKTELLGQYVCTNKNEITTENDDFNNCFIAKNSSILNEYNEVLITPIINDRYVFINDTKSLEKDVINLYDLTKAQDKTNNPTKNEYQSIDIIKSQNNIQIITSTNNEVVAKNQSGNMGLLTIDAAGIKSIIKFTDKENGGATKSINLFKDYYIVKRDMNYLYTKEGNLLTSPTQYDIVDYTDEKLIVKNGNYYMIYSDGKIINNDFIYISLKPNYFIGITKDKKLNIYDYTNKKLIADDLLITANDYENSYEFKEEKNESGIITSYIITIDNTKYKYNFDWSPVIDE